MSYQLTTLNNQPVTSIILDSPVPTIQMSNLWTYGLGSSGKSFTCSSATHGSHVWWPCQPCFPCHGNDRCVRKMKDGNGCSCTHGCGSVNLVCHCVCCQMGSYHQPLLNRYRDHHQPLALSILYHQLGITLRYHS